MAAALDDHREKCGDRVLGIALNPVDHDELLVAEVWGVPVLAWDNVEAGGFRFLCEAMGALIPQIDTFEDLLEHWTYRLQPTPPSDDSIAA
jgi:hypothetical protein